MAERGAAAPEPKASRVRVWQAADRVLRSGRRPTVEGIRELLGGGSPNSVTAYLNDWYRELGSRLVAAETPLVGFPAEAVSLMTELWRLAAVDQRGVGTGATDTDTAARANDAEREALRAEAKALVTLNQELQRHRASVEKSLAETRALLVRREAALEHERAQASEREQALAQTRMELEVAHERLRLAPAHAHPTGSRRPKARTRPKPAPRAATARKAHARKPSKPKPRGARARKAGRSRSRTRPRGRR